MGGDNSVLLQLGVGGIFAVLIIRAFVEMVKALKKTDSGSGSGSDNGVKQIIHDTKEISIDTNDKVKTLHSLHNKTNPDGLPVWYFPQSFVQDQKEIARAQEKTARHLEKVTIVQEQMCDSLKNIEKAHQ